MKINYQIILEEQISQIDIAKDGKPKLLLQSCCAPCSSYVLEYLSSFFEITTYFYNPNIHPEEEYIQRRDEQKVFNVELSKKLGVDIKFMDAIYKPKVDFFDKIKGLEEEREGGERCFKCYELRLENCVLKAKELGYDYFSTALSISPHKNAAKINEIGIELESKFDVKFLRADFKKKSGFKRSTEISVEYNLYRQDYCGCVFSKR